MICGGKGCNFLLKNFNVGTVVGQVARWASSLPVLESPTNHGLILGPIRAAERAESFFDLLVTTDAV